MDTAEILGFDKICAQTQRLCATQYARNLAMQTDFSNDYEHVRRLLLQTEEMRRLCIHNSNFFALQYVDTHHITEKIKTIGTHIVEAEMLILAQMLNTAQTIIRYLTKINTTENHTIGRFPHLLEIVSKVEACPQIVHRITELVEPSGLLSDSASPLLHALRQSMQRIVRQIEQHAQKSLKIAQNKGYAAQDAQVSIRCGCAVIPVNTANKRNIAGIVAAESASGRTCFVQPIECVELNNRLAELKSAEKRETIRILQEFTEFIRPCIPQIDHAGQMVGYMDFLYAKARMALSMNASMPALCNEPLIAWQNARHPLLEHVLTMEGKKIVPLNLQLTAQNRILLLSGPNAGGKSAALKTAGLLQYMLQCGFLPPMDSSSMAGIFDVIYIDIGDQQSLENELSTYSSHLTNIKFFLERCSPKTLILIDEFGAGTEPYFGAAIAQAALQEFVSSKTFGIVTTHYTNLKKYAQTAQGIQNGAMLYDVQNLKPLFVLEAGAAGSSFAFEIARRIGLPAAVIAAAKDLLDERQIGMDEALRSIAHNQKQWEEKQRTIADTARTTAEVAAQYSAAMNVIEKERKLILNHAKEEAQELLKYANKEIEHTIRRIREAQAERGITKELRAKLQAYAQSLQPCKNIAAEEEKIQPFTIGSAVKRRHSAAYTQPSFSPNINVHGMRTADALSKIEQWLDRALMTNFSTLKILHGKGAGTLRMEIRRYLQTLPFVENFYDERIEYGGAGITVVEIG
jgi:DNA mismatch repair protein MutS2